MPRFALRTLALTLLVPLAVVAVVPLGCSAAGGASCTDTSRASSCATTFPCGNSGIQGSCDAATQVCVVSPGMVNCVTIPGASATACPSFAAATAVAGCETGLTQTCSGSSGEGITIDCE
jgi:hypothetical protein